uniref:Helicase n=1 Tax=viral metagenome TaxID=1070528 RepID=A0A6C0DA54_9ZZZZ
MVKLCNTPYENDAIQEHFDKFPFPLSDFQKYAIDAIVSGDHVLVTAHTGSGKTLPAEFALEYFVSQGKKVVYTSPIKALSNQKFYEFTNKYPHISFGLMTGDIKTNPNADVLIMTTEILMNYLFIQNNDQKKSGLDFQIDIHNELACVVFDEVHYINDQSRGQVWEKTILMLPPHVQMVMLSATIDNPARFAKWCERGLDAEGDKQVWLASTNHRVVPLSHYGFLTTTESIFKIVKNKDIEKQIRDKTNCLIPLQTDKGMFLESGFRDLSIYTEMFQKHGVELKRKHVLNQLALFLRDRDMLPAIVFVFSRKNVELFAKEITIPLLEDDSKVGYVVRRECEQIIRKLPNFKEYMELPEYNQLVDLLEKGIGIHHSGMIPILREIVELMISKKYIKMLFATESFAIGLDCPIRTAVFTSLTKFDGNTERYLMAHEYTQMAGRAGRRGIDTIGHVVHCNNLFRVPSLSEYKLILGGVPQKLISKYQISYQLVLNLLKSGPLEKDKLYGFSEKSMVYQEIQTDISKHKSCIHDLLEKIEKKKVFVENARTPSSVCAEYIELLEKHKHVVNKKRREIENRIEQIKDENKYFVNDLSSYMDLEGMKTKHVLEVASLDHIETYITDQTNKVCKIMIDDGFLIDVDTCYQLTDLGKMASGIAEIHPLCLTFLINNWNFNEFTSEQMIGLFSCFTDVKVQQDLRMYRPNISDEFLKSKILDVMEIYKKYCGREEDMEICTGICYEDALQYDMIDYAMNWSCFENELDCKRFIQNTIPEKGISIGDFTKSMLKIVTISKEWISVFEELGNIDIVYKLTKIEGMIMKYITTSQSLYV